MPYDTSMAADTTMARLGATAHPIEAQLGALKAELEQGAPAPLSVIAQPRTRLISKL